MNIIKTNLSQKEPAMNAETVYRVDNAETVKIKHYALETLRADLVGIANIGRAGQNESAGGHAFGAVGHRDGDPPP